MTGPVTRRALGPTTTSPVVPETSTSSCFSMPPLPPVKGSASATTFQGPVSAQAIGQRAQRLVAHDAGAQRHLGLPRQRLDLAPARGLRRKVQVAHHRVRATAARLARPESETSRTKP